MSEETARDANGNLKDASELDFYESEADATPVTKPSTGTRRGSRKRDTDKLTKSLAAEKADDNGNAPVSKPKRARAPAPRVKKVPESVSDEEDEDYESMPELIEPSDSEASNDEMDIDNDELASLLPSKTIPGRSKAASSKTQTRAKTTSAGKRKQTSDSSAAPAPKKNKSATVEEVEDEDDLPVKPAVTKNPIYLFFEVVSKNAGGHAGAPGDKHYKCFHGNHQIITIGRAARSNLTKLIRHLKTHFPVMHCLYTALHTQAQPPTEEQIQLAQGTIPIDGDAAKEYLGKAEKATSSIIKGLEQQAKKLQGDFDQATFNTLLAEWMVACDQPFDEVEKPEFICLMEYTHHGSTLNFKLPGRSAIRSRIMKMGEDTVEGTRKMFAELDSKVSISLDAWTSSNQHPFLALVAHYVTNDGNLEELLIDFQELVGEHSGENMADAVWKTVELYGLEGKVLSFVVDNASNNDTLVEHFKEKCAVRDIEFDAEAARIRCMPHTVHLAALKLLESIGVISKSNRKKAEGRAGAYQDTVSAPLPRSAQDDDAQFEDEEDDEEASDGVERLRAVNKLRRIVRVIRANPQRRQAWLHEVRTNEAFADGSLGKNPLMLILDVKTRWSSTHQMLRRAIVYRKIIDDFVGKHRDMRHLELGDADWDAIILVAGWLKSFRSATSLMSTTKQPVLSHTHTIFRGLQEDLRMSLRELPLSTPSVLRNGLLEAHRKLSDYYYKSDDSPYYTWSALLDPRISYEGMKSDFDDDEDLFLALEESKSKLELHFRRYYAEKTPSPPTAPIVRTSSSQMFASPEKDFTKRYRVQRREARDELRDYFLLSREDFKTCDPVQWWFARKAQFPNLYRLARDIFSIPGSAVAVERIFSGGRDTISLRRASLKPDTIRTLMMVKQRLRLARTAVKEILGDM